MTSVAGPAAEAAEQADLEDKRGGRAPKRKSVNSSDARLAWMLISPTVLLLIVVIGYPVVSAIINSLKLDSQDAGLNAQGFFEQGGKFVGARYYQYWLSCGKSCPNGTFGHDFYPALGQTFFFTVMTVLLETFIGVLFALIMHKSFKGRGLVRAAILVPWAIPTAVTAVMWKFILQPDGVLNHVLGKQILWTGSIWPARFAIVLADVWKTTPFIALLLLAGLQLIPDELYESAKVDGASAWQRFWRITLPLVKPALLVAVLFRILDVLRIFDLPFILTGGANGTTTLSVLVVRQIRAGENSASALSTITFLVILIVAMAMVKLFGVNVVRTQAKGVK